METKQIQHGSDEHLSLMGALYHWNLLTGVDRADMLAFGRACMEAERVQMIAEGWTPPDAPLPKDALIPSVAELRELLTPNVADERRP